ncbi:hypothetical protein LZ32DRAFT_689113 [Colletotrichum eremochloae]|nr:hypothetical protein LZ32DRAFT_689113 [Colletotrichum eremochloae]
MDPLSLSLTIVGLLPVIASTIQRVQTFYSDGFNAKALIQQLVEELTALRGNLVSLQELLESPTIKAKGLKFDRSSVLVSCSKACRVKLESLCETLELFSRSRARRLTWPLAQKKCNESLQTLRNFAFWIQLGLSVEGCHLLSRNSTELSETMKQHFRELRSIQDDIQSLQTKVDTQITMIEDSRQEQNRREILNWVSNFDHEKRHLEAKGPRVENTGNWIISNSTFERWRDDPLSTNVIWCHGLPGSGKTVLASVVADHLMSLSTPEVSVSYFYLKYTDQGTQILSTILTSLLRQVLCGPANIPDSIMELFHSRQGGSQTIGNTDAVRMLLDVAKKRRALYIVLDALDECDQSQRRKLLEVVKQLVQCRSIRLLITSRTQIPDIQASLRIYPQVSIQAHDTDLRVYMQHLIFEKDEYGIIDEEFANHIKNQIIARANGTFLPVVLQLGTILRKTTRGHMEDALGSISDDLAKVFEETMARIDRLPEDHRVLAKRVLAWLVHAKADLTSEELGDALSVSDSIKMGYKSWSTRYRPGSKMMINCCQGLAIIAPVTNRLRLAHYTVQEYFEKHADRLFPGAKDDISSTCLSYLLYDDFESGPCSFGGEVDRRGTQYPFVRYAAQYWGKHVAETEQNPTVSRLLSKFLQQRTYTAAALQVMQYTRGYRDEYWAPEECLSSTPLHIVSRYGLRDTLQRLLKTDHIKDINLCTVQVKSTPVIMAAAEDNLETLDLLLSSGADPYICNWYGDALHCACEAGESQNIRKLVEFGMVPNAYRPRQRPPIICTLDNDRLDAFRTLVELAEGHLMSDPNFMSTSDPDYLQFLVIYAVKIGAYAIINWLLGNKQYYHRIEWLLRNDYNYISDNEYPFDLNARYGDRPALHQAILHGNIEMVRLLVSWGANPQAKDVDGKTALSYAANSGIGAFANLLQPDLYIVPTANN